MKKQPKARQPLIDWQSFGYNWAHFKQDRARRAVMAAFALIISMNALGLIFDPLNACHLTVVQFAILSVVSIGGIIGGALLLAPPKRSVAPFIVYPLFSLFLVGICWGLIHTLSHCYQF